jgi:hypothetical protein
MPDSMPPWSRAEAARRSVGRAAIQRALDADRIPEVTRDEAGAWVIPLDELLAAGFHADPPDPTAAVGEHDRTDAEQLRKRVHQLELELVQARADQRIAEAEKHAAEAINVELRHRLAMLQTDRRAPSEATNGEC